MKKVLKIMVVTIIAIIALVFATSCTKTVSQTQLASTNNSTMSTPEANRSLTSMEANSSRGIGTAIPAYYDSNLLKIIFVEFTSTAEATLLAHNTGLNFIYQSDPGLPDNQPFISVIDAVPGDGMNPIWEEVQITFNAGFTPRQLFSDNEVLAAASGLSPEITLKPTGEVYWCPIVGRKQ